ncbi:R8 protein [Tilletia horrida]|nr:R8 protein [Tilletia horrida]
MFYNPELLTKPKSRLGIVWLAATIGNRSSFKKLSKADVGSVNLIKICQQLAQPDEAMALRLSSQLLYGTVKIYEQQLDSLQRAAEAMQMALKRSFLQSTTGATNAEVSGLKVADPNDLTLSKRSTAAAITLKPNEYCYVGEFFFDYAQELGRVLGKDPDQIYKEQGFGSSASDSQRSASEQPRRHRAASEQAREASYTNNARKPWQLPDAGLGAALSASLGGSQSDQGLGFDGGADIDLGLFDGLDGVGFPSPPPLQHTGPAGAQHALADDVEMAQLEVGVFGIDKNRGGILAEPGIGLAGQEARKRRGSKSGSDISIGIGRDAVPRAGSNGLLDGPGADEMIFEWDFEAALPGTPAHSDGQISNANRSHSKRARSDDFADLVAGNENGVSGLALRGAIPSPAPPARKRTRVYTRKRMTTDKRTQLTQDEMRASRQDYVKRQAEIRNKQAALKRQRAVDHWVADMMGVKMFGDHGDPWTDVVAEVLIQKDDEWTSFKTTAQNDFAQQGGTVFVQDAVESLASAVIAAVSSSPALSILRGDPGIKGMSDKAKGKQRAISPRSPAAMRSLGFDGFGRAIPMQRREGSVSIGDGRQGSVGPSFSFGPGAGDALDFGGFDAGSMPDLGLRSRQGSMGPQPIFNASRQGSVARNFAENDMDSLSSVGVPRQLVMPPSPLATLVPWSQPIEGTQGQFSHDLSQRLPSAFLLSPGAASAPRRSATPGAGPYSLAGTSASAALVAANGDGMATQTTATESQVERDLNNFLKYAKKLSTSKGDAGSLLLSDIAPVGTVSRTTACKAFYNTLVLSTAGKMTVHQEKAYGPLQLDFA